MGSMILKFWYVDLSFADTMQSNQRDRPSSARTLTDKLFRLRRRHYLVLYK